MNTKISSKELKNDSLCLLQEYQQSASLELRNQIVQLNIGLVRKEAHQWLNHCTESYEDLVQVGCIGLIRAIESFKMSFRHAFSSFARPYIRGEIQHYLRDKSNTVRIQRRWKGLQKQAASVKRDLQEKWHRKPTDREIAEALEISAEEWSEIKLANQNQTPLSLDAPVEEEGEKVICLGEMVPDTGYRSFQLIGPRRPDSPPAGPGAAGKAHSPSPGICIFTRLNPKRNGRTLGNQCSDSFPPGEKRVGTAEKVNGWDGVN